MRKLNFIVLLFLLASCAKQNETVFWCGDHPCKNKKEIKTYFEKTMMVEIKKIGAKEKKLLKVKNYDDLAKKQETIKSKNLSLKDKTENKKVAKINKKKYTEDKGKTKDKKITDVSTNLSYTDNFDEIIKMLLKKTENRPFPDINDFPG